jgi:sulfur-carrier protein
MRIVYFAWVRETIGLDTEERILPDDVRTVGDCVKWLAAHDGNHAAALADQSKLRFALDQHMAGHETMVEGASELAIFPPVTGG